VLTSSVEKALKDGTTLKKRRLGGSGSSLELANGGALWAISVNQQHAGRGMRVDRLVNYTGRPLPERVLLALVAAVRP
jgi:hypothetical protein